MKRDVLNTGNLEYKRAIYNFTNKNSLDTVFDFTLEDLNSSNDNLFTDIIRIEKDNGFHDTSRDFENWLYFRDTTNWKRCKRTGLALTTKENVFYGDITQEVILKTKTPKGKDWETAEHLILVQIDKDFKKVVIDVFKYFHTYKKPLIALIIKEHQFYLK
tara:strand:- start:530 stop:1009 length:480 start_codon:yes stop_codon:yes gene_type:complete